MSEALKDRINSEIGGRLASLEVRTPRRIYIDVEPANLVEAVRCLFDTLGARFATASGTHLESGFEVVYHFVFDDEGVVVNLRATAGGEPPQLDSITPLIKGASFIEREMHDLLGINFRGHPNLKRLILPENWPDDVHPLRRGKPWEGKVEKKI